MDKCADLLPECFAFVRGVVDSPDLSLNISRELLQHDRQLKVIAGSIEKKIKAELKKLMAPIGNSSLPIGRSDALVSTDKAVADQLGIQYVC